jgi:hypothetical protein
LSFTWDKLDLLSGIGQAARLRHRQEPHAMPLRAKLKALYPPDWRDISDCGVDTSPWGKVR